MLLQRNTEVTEGNFTEISGNTEIENIEKEEMKLREKREEGAEEIMAYFSAPVLNSMFLSYIEYRKECGKEVKGKAIDYCIEKLDDLFTNPKEQVEIIKQTIQNGWTDFFPLKVQKKKGKVSCVSSWLEHENVQNVGGVFCE